MDKNKFNFEEAINRIALLAPTGRASKRMSESTQLPASTIHRFLKWNKENNTFAVNELDKDYSVKVSNPRQVDDSGQLAKHYVGLNVLPGQGIKFVVIVFTYN